MANQELLSKLKDVHLPADPGWWPLAMGWWLLFLLIILTLISFTVHHYRQRQKHRFSRHALSLLDTLEKQNSIDWLIELEVILKRSALSYFPKKSIAQLNQQGWINFLMNTGNQIWSDESLYALRDCVYQNPLKFSSLDKSLILKQARQWLKQLPEQAKSYQTGASNV